MIKLRMFGMLTGAALLAGVLFALLGFAPALAQESPAVIGDLAPVKYVCPTNVGGTGTSIPAVCADANNPNGSDVPVIPVSGAVSFIYQVTYTCRPGVICEPLNPISVTIFDNQISEPMRNLKRMATENRAFRISIKLLRAYGGCLGTERR